MNLYRLVHLQGNVSELINILIRIRGSKPGRLNQVRFKKLICFENRQATDLK